MSISKEERVKIKQFFKLAQELKKSGVIRSSKYSGDISEFICSKIYDIELNDSNRQKGCDGIGRNKISWRK